MKDSVFISCPFHEGDRTPSLSVLLRDRGNLKAGFCHCFGCGWSGNVAQVERRLGHKLDLPVNIPTAGQRSSSPTITRLKTAQAVEEITGIKKKDVPFKFSPYLKERGIGEVVQSFNRVYEKNGSVIMPFFDIYGKMDGYIERRVGDKWYGVTGQVKFPMGIEEVSPLDFVYVTEGQIDKMSLEELGFRAVALGTVSNYRLISNIKNFNICLAYDNDGAGDKARVLTRDLFRQKNFFSLSLPKGIKDVNELLLTYGTESARNWVKANTGVYR